MYVNYVRTLYSEAENATLMRFGKVFEQTYTRFHDLKQAKHRQEKHRLKQHWKKFVQEQWPCSEAKNWLKWQPFFSNR